jgi:arginase family enzyme
MIRAVSKQYTWSAADPCVMDVDEPDSPLRGAVDIGDLRVGEGADSEDPSVRASALTSYMRELRTVVGGLPPGVAPCVIGGDHSVSLAVVQGLQDRGEAPFDVVQFDHHLDLQIWGKVEAGPEAALDPLFNTNVMSHVSRAIRPGSLMQIGVGPYATAEAGSAHAVREYLAQVGPRFSVLSPAIRDDALFRAGTTVGKRVYLTVDVDVLQASEMSSTPYPAPVGLSVGRLLHLIALVLEGRQLVGFDVVEFAADRKDRSEKTLTDASRAALIFLRLLHRIVRQEPSPGAAGASPANGL